MKLFHKYFIPVIAVIIGLALLLVLPTLIGIVIFYPLAVVAEYATENHKRAFLALGALIAILLYFLQRRQKRK